MTFSLQKPHSNMLRVGVFALIQIGVMLIAISNESLWVDEFWTAYFAATESFKAFLELLLVPYGSQTPLHFLHFYLWGLLHPVDEFHFRLANLLPFVLGQLAVFRALLDYPKKFAYLYLILSAVHPMVWQYANEARPYILMYAGSQMMLAYLLNLRDKSANGRSARPFFMTLFVLGGILLFGASMLGVFWVFVACLYVLLHHIRESTWRELLRGINLALLGFFLVSAALLTVYYLNSLVLGAGGSRLASSSAVTVLSAAYEVLGLAGIGPSRLELRSLGPVALVPYALSLLVAAGVLLMVVAVGLTEARARLGTREVLLMGTFALFPVGVVIFSGFAMHWRVAGRHLFAALPVLNLVFALGLATLLQADGRRHQRIRWLLAVLALLILVYSSCSLRFSAQHRKDDYRAAAALAQAALSQGQRVWWAADVIGAHYYGLPGEFDVFGELGGQSKPLACRDLPGAQSVANASTPCLLSLSMPDVVILSKPDTFDSHGDIAGYLNARHFVVVQRFPAFTIWRSPSRPPTLKD